jgi:dipeptidyl aminopeptidase/acylaminoacyl peptidase
MLDNSADRAWERRFRLPMVLATQIARVRPERGLAIAVTGGAYQLHAWQVPEGRLTQLTFGSANIQRGHLAPDGRHIYYLHDEVGGERGHYVRVPFTGGDSEDIAPDLPPYASLVFTSSGDGSMLAYVTLTAAGAQLFLQRVGPSGALNVPQLVHQAVHIGSTVLSRDADLVACYQPDRKASVVSSISVLDTTSGAVVATIRDGEESHIVPIAFCPLAGDPRLLATSDKSRHTRPLLCNPRTGKSDEMHLDALDGDVVPLDWSADGGTLLLCQRARAQERLYSYELANHRLHALAHPSGSVTGRLSNPGTYFAPGGAEVYVQWENGLQPPQVLAIDAHTGEQTRSVLRLGEEVPGHTWQSVEFASADGTIVQGWLGQPSESARGGVVPTGTAVDAERATDPVQPVPTVIYLHGGPFAVQLDWYLLPAETWVDAGFAVLVLNYRGSTTFGREFERAILGDAGHLELEDMAAAHHWLVAQTIARPDAIFLHGHSYGGYLTLLALGKQPELWAGGIPVGAVTDWPTLVEDGLPSMRITAAVLLGGSRQDAPERYRERSPLTYAEQVRAPILAMHGRNDARSPAGQMQRYETRLRELGKSIEVV